MTKTEKQKYKHPFRVYQDLICLINAGDLSDELKHILCSVCSYALPPAELGFVAEAASILREFNIDTPFSQYLKSNIIDDFIQQHQGNSKPSHSKALDFPVFTAIKKFRDPELWPSEKIRDLCLNLYLTSFNFDSISRSDIDPYIFYIDAYYCRDALLNFADVLVYSDDDLTSIKKFKTAMINQCQILLGNEKKETLKFRKLSHLYTIILGTRIPGERQRKKTNRTHDPKKFVDSIPPDPSSDDNGSGNEITYPDVDSENQITYTRSTPAKGSKLTYKDDKRSIKGRANAQAARNIFSITDMHRLPFPCVSSFFAHLVSIKLQILAYYWMLITTGLDPKRLQDLIIKSGNRPEDYQGLYIDKDTAVLSYEVINRTDEDTHDLMQLNVSKKIVAYISEYGNGHPFQNMQPEIEKVVRKFSLHNPGQSPTPDRISASCVIDFSMSYFSEIESAYLSGNIPPRLRAQAHYYPIDLKKINQKYRIAHKAFIARLLHTPSSYGLAEPFFEDFLEFKSIIPTGIIGSVDSIPITDLQSVLDKLSFQLNQAKRNYHNSFPMDQLLYLSKFIKMEHIQLFIIEQLTFCARKFGDKTSYSISLSERSAWGSEKASVGASIERKLAPLSNLLERLLHVCEADMAQFESLATRFKYSFEGDFNIRSKPLPVDITIDDDQRQIKLTKMHSKNFHSLLKEMNISDMPKPSSEKKNIFKHIMAGALLNKIPQVLLDEIMTHDRDGLDFCSSFGTGSATSMRIVRETMEKLFAKLHFQLISLEEQK